jgi:hypothetical protein
LREAGGDRRSILIADLAASMCFAAALSDFIPACDFEIATKAEPISAAKNMSREKR